MRFATALVTSLLGFGGIGGLGTLGCSDSTPPVEDFTKPVLTITSPARGTSIAGDVVVVSGTVEDSESGPVQVLINGVSAELQADGSFAATLAVDAGVTILETVALDGAGNEATDHRGVLAGQHVPIGTTVRDALVAELGIMAFSDLADIGAVQLSTLDFPAIGEAINPIVDRGNSCFGVEVDLRDVTFDDLKINLTPTNDGIVVSAIASNLDVDMRAAWELSCFGGGAGLTIRADTVALNGTIELALVSGEFVASFVDGTASFTGFDLDVGAIPGSIVDLFSSEIGDRVGGALLGTIEDQLPPIIVSSLENLRDSEVEQTLLGVESLTRLTPTQLDLNDSGLRVNLDFSTSSPGLEEATYVATPQPAPTAPMSEGIALSIADDVANQFLALLWHGGGLSVDVEVGGTPLRDVFPTADRVLVSPMLPPMISTRGDEPTAKVSVADLILTALDSEGQPIAELALSGHVELEVATADNGDSRFEAVVTGLTASILRGEIALGLSERQIEIFAAVGVSELKRQANQWLGALTIPSVGASISSPTMSATRGYLLIETDLDPLD